MVCEVRCTTGTGATRPTREMEARHANTPVGLSAGAVGFSPAPVSGPLDRSSSVHTHVLKDRRLCDLG